MILLLGAELAEMAEGRFFPVTGRLSLSDPRPQGTSSVWSARVEKLRDCTFLRIEWYLGRRDGRRVRVGVTIHDAPQIRLPGVIDLDAIEIALPVEMVATRSFANVVHRCVGRPWLTRTALYDPPPAPPAQP
ncbi:MAG: hypothetical protein ACU0BF_05100 [Paracoccaceae bacterium]